MAGPSSSSETSIQSAVFQLEMGRGKKVIQWAALVLLAAVLSPIYTASQFRNGLGKREAIDMAQLARNIARGEGFPDAAFTVAYLKRALDHLHKSQAGLEAVAPKKLLPETTITEARKELFEIREGILRRSRAVLGPLSDGAIP